MMLLPLPFEQEYLLTATLYPVRCFETLHALVLIRLKIEQKESLRGFLTVQLPLFVLQELLGIAAQSKFSLL